MSGLLSTSAGPASTRGTFRPESGVLLVANPTAGLAPLLVDFNLTLPSGAPAYLRWSFGDGAWLNGSSDSIAQPSHDYLSAGTFIAVVWADYSSGSLNASVRIDAFRSNLSVVVNASATRGVAPLTVWLNGTPSGGSGTYVSALWAFGDGKVGSGESVRYTFDVPGTYHPELTVTDSRQSTANATVWVNVSAGPSSGGKPGPGPGGASPSARLSPFAGPLVLGLLAVGGASIVGVAVWARWGRRRHGFPSPKRESKPGPSLPDPASESPPPRALPGDAAGGTVPSPAIAGSEGAITLAASTSMISPEVPPPPGPVTQAAPSTAARQLSYGLVRHLATLPRWSFSDLPSMAWTQAGMAESLGVGQSTVSRILRRLEAAGVVTSETSHVTGSSRRMRVYRLTGQGERLGRALRETDLERVRPDVLPEPVRPARKRPLGATDPPPAVANQ